MKYIELFWNRLYYCIFNCDKKTQTLLNRFFECLFYYLKFYRNRKGNNTRIPYNETVGICVSDYIMIGFTCLLIWTLLAHPTNPVESCADANQKLLPNDT